MMRLKGPVGVILATMALCIAVRAQDDERVTIDASLVTVNVAVSDAHGRPIKGLQRDQFAIFDNKVRQKIAHFSAEDAPFSIGIVYDIHPSTPERMDAGLRAIKQFTGMLRHEDDFFLMVFNERGSVVVDFVPTADQVANHLTFAAAKGPTALYDAVFEASIKLRAARNMKKALLIISDGKDHNSGHSDREVRNRVRELNIQVYGVGLADHYDGGSAGNGRWTFEDLTRQTGRRRSLSDIDAALGRAALEEMTRVSGGAAYFPRATPGERELTGICAQISLELRQQYALAFRPERTSATPEWHRLEVRVAHTPGSGKLRLSYRRSYRSFLPR